MSAIANSQASGNSDKMSFPKEPPLPPISAGINSTNASDDLVNINGFTKLTNVEAQRIMSVINEIQRKVLLIGLLPDHLDRRTANIFTGELYTTLVEHGKSEQKYKQLLDQKDTLDAQSGEISETILADLRETSRQLRNSTRTLYRLFLQNPASMNKLRILKSVKAPAVLKFEQLLQEIRTLIYDRLRTTVEEEKAKQDQLSVIIAKEQKTSNEVKVLQEELEKARRERSNEISKRNEVIRKLKEDLRLMKQEAEETTKRLESRSKQKEDNDIQKFQDKETTLQRDIDSLKSALRENLKENRDEEEGLRKKKFKIESEVENWIHKYDQEMEEKQNELEDISVIYNEEKTQLDELQSRYAAIHFEYDNIIEERRVNAEINKKEEEDLKRKVAAVVLIQAVWRGFKVRKEIAKKKKSGKERAKKKK